MTQGSVGTVLMNWVSSDLQKGISKTESFAGLFGKSRGMVWTKLLNNEPRYIYQAEDLFLCCNAWMISRSKASFCIYLWQKSPFTAGLIVWALLPTETNFGHSYFHEGSITLNEKSGSSPLPIPPHATKLFRQQLCTQPLMVLSLGTGTNLFWISIIGAYLIFPSSLAMNCASGILCKIIIIDMNFLLKYKCQLDDNEAWDRYKDSKHLQKLDFNPAWRKGTRAVLRTELRLGRLTLFSLHQYCQNHWLRIINTFCF